METLTETRRRRLKQLLDGQDWGAPASDRTTAAFARRTAIDRRQVLDLMREFERTDSRLRGVMDTVNGRLQVVWKRMPPAGDDVPNALRPHMAAAIGGAS